MKHMSSVQSGKMIVGLDIGTSKVVALVGEVTADGELEIVGIGTHPSRGLKKGVVVNIESTVQSVQRAKIGRAHVCTPVTNAHLVCRLLLEIKTHHNTKQ